ncbi:MAG TPA: DUF6542 domain-containing protein [Streptosporangiaceae bacterium]|jgi:hypothetical protein
MSQPQWREPEAPYSYREASRRNGGAYAATRTGDRRSREAGRSQPPATSQLARRWGQLPGRFGVLVIIGSAAIGALVTAVTGHAPGIALGVCLVAGTLAGALAVRPRTGYLILPVPAIAYLVAALIAGLIYNRSNDGSSTFLAVNGTQWIASGFIAMAVATGVAIVITAIRWRRFSPLRDEDYRPPRDEHRRTGSGRRADRAFLSAAAAQTTFSADRQT